MGVCVFDCLMEAPRRADFEALCSEPERAVGADPKSNAEPACLQGFTI